MAYTKVVITDPIYLQTTTYSAQDDRRALGDIMGPGVVGSLDFGCNWLSGLTVRVSAGVAYIPGLMVADQGIYRVYESTNHDIAVGAGDATNPRLDQIILRVMDKIHDTSGLDETRIEVVPGVPTSGATLVNRSGAADLTALTENSKNVLLLADVLVPIGAAAISQSAIGDRRLFASVGGGKATSGSGAFFKQILAVDTAQFDIVSIPQTGSVLEVFALLRTSQASVSSTALVRFNNDTGANYDYQKHKDFASSHTDSEALAQTSGLLTDCPGNSATALKYASVHMVIPHYASAISHLTAMVDAADVEGQATGLLANIQVSINWRNPAALNRITIIAGGSSLFKADSLVSCVVR